ncbi:MAG: hypothetical protein KDH48_01355 [Rhodoferax sp.]|nr:hypothetical protein [Rhodoferax sp.]
MTIRWPSRILAFLLWTLAALSAAYWLLKIVGLSEAPVTAGAVNAETPSIDVPMLARALGPDNAAPTSAALAPPSPLAQDPGGRMRLLGVVAGRTSGGVALISIEGQHPRPYRVGSVIDERYKLTQVATRSATLAPTQAGAPAITLELPLATSEPQTPLPAAAASPTPPSPAAAAVNRAIAARPPQPEPPSAVGDAEEPPKD